MKTALSNVLAIAIPVAGAAGLLGVFAGTGRLAAPAARLEPESAIGVARHHAHRVGPEPCVETVVEDNRTASSSRPQDVPGRSAKELELAQDPPRPTPSHTVLAVREILERRFVAQDPSGDPGAFDPEVALSLEALSPEEFLALYLEDALPDISPVLERALEKALLRDRATWEAAVVQSATESRELPRREAILRLADRIVVEPECRLAAARAALEGDSSDCLLELAGRLAGPDGATEIEQILWSRLPAPGAIAGLGYVTDPENVDRLRQLGPSPALRRALRAILARTRDPRIARLRTAYTTEQHHLPPAQ